ncbi:MAG: hypothetical protein GKR91_11895 [Pseudomonadales bacterium]|nr:hypothetical protein [Pseudomonadales bacterium]
MSSTSNSPNLGLVPSFLALGVSLLTFSISAQEIDLDSRIQSATESLAELDSKAKTCLDNLEQGVSDQAVASCEEFLQSVDGDLLAGYLSHCEELKSWREEFVTSEVSDAGDAETNLALLRGIELNCGEGALQKRTEHVVTAFNLLQGGSAQSQASTAVNRRVSELEFQQSLNAQRRLLQNSVQQLNQRTRIQTNRQWDDLQEELIRQQINKPPFPNN